MRSWMLMSLLSLVVLWPHQADACSCVAGPAFVQPQSGATNVPLNATFQVGYTYYAPLEASLVRADGVSIPLSFETQTYGNVTLYTYKPAAGYYLEANSRYTLLSDGMELSQFATGASRDVQAPTLEAISSFAGGFDDGCTDGMCTSCGDSLMLDLQYQRPADTETPTEGLLYRVYYARGGAIPDQNSPSVLLTSYMGLGYNLCTSTVPDLTVGETVTVRAATVDWAGNQSALSAPMTTVVADDPDTNTGCSASQVVEARPVRGSWLWMSLLGLPLLAMRRRRA